MQMKLPKGATREKDEEKNLMRMFKILREV